MKHIFLTTISLLAGLVLHAQNINSGQRTINCQGRTYDINRTFSSIAVADNNNADFPAFANGAQSLPIDTQTRQQYMTFQGDNWMYPFKHEADCERVFDSVQEVFCIRELSTLARSADELYVACTVNPQNGHIMELKFTVYNLHDNVLVNNISVRKLAALEDQLKANLVFDNIPSEYQDASFVLGEARIRFDNLYNQRYSGRLYITEDCLGCGACVSACPVRAIYEGSDGFYKINPNLCIQCGSCVDICPINAIMTLE